MAEKKQERRGLGRGLSALMADVELPQQPNGERRPETTIAIEKIHPNPDQPRRSFVTESLEELASSIAQKGVIQCHPRQVRTGFHRRGLQDVAPDTGAFGVAVNPLDEDRVNMGEVIGHLPELGLVAHVGGGRGLRRDGGCCGGDTL